MDLAKALGWTHGIVTLYLRSLIASRTVAKEKTGPAVRYRVWHSRKVGITTN